MRCPICGTEITHPPFKGWTYSKYKVSRYECKECGEKFNFYISDDGTEFTVPKEVEDAE